MSIIPFPYNIAAGAALVIVLVAGGFTAGYEHEAHKLISLKATIAQEAKDQQKQVDDINIKNNYIEKEAYNALQTQLIASTNAADDLAQRLRNQPAGSPIIVSQSDNTACRPAIATAAAAGNTEPAAAVGPATEVSTLNTEILRDDLTLAITHANQLLVIVKERDSLE